MLCHELFEAERFHGSNRFGESYHVLLNPTAAMLAFMIRQSGDNSVRVVSDRAGDIAIADARRAVHIEMKRTLAQNGVDIDVADTSGDLWVVSALHAFANPHAPTYLVGGEQVGVYDSVGRPADPARWPNGLRRLVKQ